MLVRGWIFVCVYISFCSQGMAFNTISSVTNSVNTLPGFNSTLRQGNITHHEYIQVLYFLLEGYPYFIWYLLFSAGGGEIGFFSNNVVVCYRLEKGGMLALIRSHSLKEKFLVVMENKFWAGTFTGLGNFLIFSECCRSTLQVLDFMCAPWYLS